MEYMCVCIFYIFVCLQLCVIESESKDDELRHDALITLACLAQCLLSTEVIPIVLDTIKQVSGRSSHSCFETYIHLVSYIIYCLYMTKLYGYDRNDDGIMLNKRIY